MKRSMNANPQAGGNTPTLGLPFPIGCSSPGAFPLLAGAARFLVPFSPAGAAQRGGERLLRVGMVCSLFPCFQKNALYRSKPT